jgi:hypothetical protein
VALLLLALLAAPIALEAFGDTDSHRCCPESAAATESPMPCQYVAALGCCAQLGLPATAVGDGLRTSPLVLALVAFSALPALPLVHAFAHARGGHGPPQASLLRTTVLRL